MSFFTDKSKNKEQAPSVSIPSPYLNFDPTIITNEPEFILPEGGTGSRGRMELAFSEIGTVVILSTGFGSAYGLYTGLLSVRGQDLMPTIRRTQIWNHITKRGSAWAQTFGIPVVLYALAGNILSLSRGVDDEMNSLAGGAVAGSLFRMRHGIRATLIGGIVGTGLAGAYCLFKLRTMHPDRLEHFTKRSGFFNR